MSRYQTITGHWHEWKYVLGPVADCDGCPPAPPAGEPAP